MAKVKRFWRLNSRSQPRAEIAVSNFLGQILGSQLDQNLQESKIKLFLRLGAHEPCEVFSFDIAKMLAIKLQERLFDRCEVRAESLLKLNFQSFDLFSYSLMTSRNLAGR